MARRAQSCLDIILFQPRSSLWCYTDRLSCMIVANARSFMKHHGEHALERAASEVAVQSPSTSLRLMVAWSLANLDPVHKSR
jgi:hypothetical protein